MGSGTSGTSGRARRIGRFGGGRLGNRAVDQFRRRNPATRLGRRGGRRRTLIRPRPRSRHRVPVPRNRGPSGGRRGRATGRSRRAGRCRHVPALAGMRRRGPGPAVLLPPPPVARPIAQRLALPPRLDRHAVQLLGDVGALRGYEAAPVQIRRRRDLVDRLLVGDLLDGDVHPGLEPGPHAVAAVDDFGPEDENRLPNAMLADIRDQVFVDGWRQQGKQRRRGVNGVGDPVDDIGLLACQFVTIRSGLVRRHRPETSPLHTSCARRRPAPLSGAGWGRTNDAGSVRPLRPPRERPGRRRRHRRPRKQRPDPAPLAGRFADRRKESVPPRPGRADRRSRAATRRSPRGDSARLSVVEGGKYSVVPTASRSAATSSANRRRRCCM